MSSQKAMLKKVGMVIAFPAKFLYHHFTSLPTKAKVFVNVALFIAAGVLAVAIQTTMSAIELQEQYKSQTQALEQLQKEHQEAKEFYKSHVMRLVRQRDILSEAKNDATKPMPTISVGIGNNNLGNVKKPDSGHWQGTIGYDRRNFAVFSHHVYSIRATAITLLAYEHKHHINTIDKLIDRYSKTDRVAYKKYLSKRLGIGITQRFSITKKLPELVDAIITFEVSHEEREACGVTRKDVLVGCKMALADSRYTRN